MLRCLYGHKSPNASEGCVWCKCDLRKDVITFEDLKILQNSFEKSKTYQVANGNVRAVTKARKVPIKINGKIESYYLTQKDWPIGRDIDVIDEGHQYPIIDFIPYENCVIDLLHLLLRVSDKLFDLLIWKLEKIDNNKGTDINKRVTFKIFIDFLKNDCKISNPCYISKKEDKIKLRSLNGNEKQKIFDKIFEPYDNTTFRRKSFEDLFPPHLIPEEIDFVPESLVWFDFSEILKRIKKFDEIDLDKLNEDLQNWLEIYLAINFECGAGRTLTPYIQTFCYHLVDMLDKYGNINKFCTQSLEKLNHFCTQYYHLCSNKKNTDKKYLQQLIEKRNRIEFYALKGVINYEESSDEDEEEQDFEIERDMDI